MGVGITIFLIEATFYGAAIPFGIVSAWVSFWLLLSWLIRGF